MRRLKWIAFLSALAAATFAGARYGKAVSRLAEVEREMAGRQPRLEELAPVISQIESFKENRATRERKRALIDALPADPFPEGLLRQLSDASPAGLSLDRIVVDSRGFDQGTVETPEGRWPTRRGARIEIAGRADKVDSVTGWGERLEALGFLERFEVTSEKVSEGEAVDGVDFTLSGRLAPVRSEPTGDDADARESVEEARP